MGFPPAAPTNISLLPGGSWRLLHLLLLLPKDVGGGAAKKRPPLELSCVTQHRLGVGRGCTDGGVAVGCVCVGGGHCRDRALNSGLNPAQKWLR